MGVEMSLMLSLIFRGHLLNDFCIQSSRDLKLRMSSMLQPNE